MLRVGRVASTGVSIHGLVAALREHEDELQVANEFKIISCDSQSAAVATTGRELQFQSSVQQQQQQQQLQRNSSEVAELTCSKPGMKSYRRLPLMNSLVRPVRSQLSAKVAPLNERNAQLNFDCHSAGLMALVRETRDSRQIRWPANSVPQRPKKLTWDDELSCGGGQSESLANAAASRI